MRRHLTIPCGSVTIAGSLDEAARATALLIVSGGNEIMAGAHRGMASIAADVAGAGYPVLRFDRRGVGDSEGENHGYRSSADDIAAAMAALRSACPHVTRIVAFGNCDAASALVLHHDHAPIDALILANPWVLDDEGGAVDSDAEPSPLPPPSAIRARYIAKLKNPRELWRLISGGVDLKKLLSGIKASRATTLACAAGEDIAETMGAMRVPVTILIAERDRTAQAFMAQWEQPHFANARAHATLASLNSASHSFADTAARRWLLEQILAVLDTQAP